MALSAEQRKRLLAHPAGWIATGFGAGFSPVAPGTAGSLVALVPWLALRELTPPYYALACAAAFLLGVWACAFAVRTLGRDDPGPAVWDEFVGQWVALAPLLWYPVNAMWILLGFILFRMFDIAKPWPVSWADRKVGGGLGVMLDDLIAGGLAAGVLALVRALA